MRGACIDIGSNTTRLLVADCEGGQLSPIAQERVFTHIARGRQGDGTLSQAKIAEVAQVVSEQLRHAQELGAHHIRVVATAAIRRAPNSLALAGAVESQSGLAMEILSGEEEARLAFVGAANAIGALAPNLIGVVDVGGGSCELAVGEPPGAIGWSASFTLGSSDLTEDFLSSDPPAASELEAARACVTETFSGLHPPAPSTAVAVGGSAASLGRVAGPHLDEAAFDRAQALLAGASAGEIAARYGLAEDRVRLLPAGLVILQAAAQQFGLPLIVGGGGIREGVLLESCGG